MCLLLPILSPPTPLLPPIRTYINKKATGKQIVFVSRVMVLVYGVLSGVLAIILLKIGLSLGWVYLVSEEEG
jgi:Na+/proline symporter